MMIEMTKSNGQWKEGDRLKVFNRCSGTGDAFAGTSKQNASWISEKYWKVFKLP